MKETSKTSREKAPGKEVDSYFLPQTKHLNKDGVKMMGNVGSKIPSDAH